MAMSYSDLLIWAELHQEQMAKTFKSAGWWIVPGAVLFGAGGLLNMALGSKDQVVQEIQAISNDYSPNSHNWWTSVSSSCEGGGWFCTDGDARDWISRYKRQLDEEQEVVVGYQNAAQARGAELDEQELMRAASWAENKAAFYDTFGEYPLNTPLLEGWTDTDDILRIIIANAQGIRASNERVRQWALDSKKNQLEIPGFDAQKYKDDEDKSDPVKMLALGALAVGAIYMLGRSSKKTPKTTLPV